MTLSTALQAAIEKLQLDDVYLRHSISRCDGDFDPRYTSDFSKLQVQHMHKIRESSIAELTGDDRLLRIYIELGIRWVEPTDNPDEPNVLALIEAEFVTSYAFQMPLEQESIDEFSLKNASVHAWPYWREFVSSQAERLRLPRTVLPARQFTRHDVGLSAEEKKDA